MSVLAEEAALGERGGAGAAREAGRVEVLVGHAQHLAAALAAARAAHHLACNTVNNNLNYLPVGAYAVLYVRLIFIYLFIISTHFLSTRCLAYVLVVKKCTTFNLKSID